MATAVDWDGIRQRHRSARSQMRPQCDTWFVLDGGLPKQESFDLVQAACEATGEPIRVYAITGGTFVSFWMRQWQPVLQTVVNTLARQGHDVSVTVPPSHPWSLKFPMEALPFAAMMHRLEPPMSVESMAHPYVPNRWNVPAEAKQRLFQRAGNWCIRDGEYGAAGELGQITATRAEVPEILNGILTDTKPAEFAYVDGYTPDGQADRVIAFAHWGASAWASRFDDVDQLDRALHLRELLIEFAADIEIGWINLQHSNSQGSYLRDGTLWGITPQLWSIHAPDVAGIMVLTDSHLARAHDLSDWHIEPLTTDRFLVQHKDLAAWFPTTPDAEYPQNDDLRVDPDIKAKARHDFGNLILTDDQFNKYSAAVKAR